MRVWIWVVAMALAAVVAGFFAVMTVLPLGPVGEPVFDTVIVRAQFWGGYGIVLMQFAGLPLWFALLLSARDWQRVICSLLALGFTGFCLFAMIAEYGSLIQFGDLRDPVPVAAHKLMVSRALTLGSAVAGLIAGWLARPKAAAPLPT